MFVSENWQCEPCDNRDFSHDETQQPFVLSILTLFFIFLGTQTVCRFICSAVTAVSSQMLVSFKYSIEGKKLSPRVKFLWTQYTALSGPRPLRAALWLGAPVLSLPLIGCSCWQVWALVSTGWSPGEMSPSERGPGQICRLVDHVRTRARAAAAGHLFMVILIAAKHSEFL